MKNIIVSFVVFVLCMVTGHVTQAERHVVGPVLKCNALSGFRQFLIAPQYSISDATVREEVEQALIQQLSSMGKVVRLKIPDVTGVGNAEGMLVLHIDILNTVSGKKLPYSTASLSLFTSTMIEKTKNQCQSSEIWRCQTVSDHKLDASHPEGFLNLITPLLVEFQTAYKTENKNSDPVFYLYE